MKLVRFVLAALAVAALSACYTSKSALIGDDAVTPYTKMTFVGRDGDGEAVVFEKDGTGYLTRGENGQEVRLHLQAVEGDYYVAQLSGPPEEAGPQFLFGYLRIDPVAKTAETWHSLGTAADVRPGLSLCDDVICIDDLAAYIAYAKEAVAAGAAPDNTFDVTLE